MVDLVALLIDAVVGGAAAAAKGVATESVTSAYNAVKEAVGSRLSNWSQLEKMPENSAFRAAAEAEIKEYDLAGDSNLLTKITALQEALAILPPDRAEAVGIDLRRIRAGRDMVITHLHSIASVVVHDIEAKGTVRIENLNAGGSEKNC